MALADFYSRAALAASQVLSGFQPGLFEERLNSATVGIAWSAEAEGTREGQLIVDLTVRLLARLYPALDISAPNGASPLARRTRRLARAINPEISLTRSARSNVGIAVGQAGAFDTCVFAGSDNWDALISTEAPQQVGQTSNPIGAGIAACLASANVFRRIFVDSADTTLDRNVRLSGWTLGRDPTPAEVRSDTWSIKDEAVLVGVGAIGMAAAWALARAPLEGTLHLVDPEDIDLGNLQRYVLTVRADAGRSKVLVAGRAFQGSLNVRRHHTDWASFVHQRGYQWRHVIAALDSAAARRAVQGSLPRWIANAWTQPGDLGVSVHPFFGDDGACVACLYLPDRRLQSEDELIAEALGVPNRILDVRTLLHLGTPTPRPLLEEVAAALHVSKRDVLAFEGRPLRDLYVQGVCGGAVLPLGQAGQPRADVHVPLAHQSALAGVLLAAALCRELVGGGPTSTLVARLDVLRPVPDSIVQPARRAGDGRCICDDKDFVQVYRSKYAPA